MRQHAVSLKQAVFGWPFFIGWNLVAYTREQRGTAAKLAVGFAAMLFAVLTTALWAALWLAPVGLILLLR